VVLVSPSVYNEITKRKELIRYLENNGASFVREGRRHSIYHRGKYRTEIPRHNEIVNELARKICRDLDIPFVK
jgi:predicted RNA binding protein YcfA (HicA-like mRNA interferase family)